MDIVRILLQTMRALLFLLSLIMATPSLAQPGNQVDAKGLKQGAWKDRYENGNLRYSGQFNDDKPVGTFTYYDEERVKTKEVIFSNDTAYATFFHTTKVVMAKGIYIDKEKVGEWLYFDEEGDLSHKEFFVANKIDGKVITFYKNGSIAREQEFKAGVKHGTCKDYFKGGKPKFEGHYLDGNLDGKVTHYHPNGLEWQRGKYVASVQDGKWLYFDENGVLQYIETYKLGDLIETKKIPEKE
ncbi:toxin-antitoxin system YwqK family antitoxin [Salibacteraceae bacterium]|jgi:antitoxin component YwqK of YwqJK toxin-antitoxin module|nr:toxin-antitoxin system YwqK family antitoxin [Salibacteraceae bacterium]